MTRDFILEWTVVCIESDKDIETFEGERSLEKDKVSTREEGCFVNIILELSASVIIGIYEPMGDSFWFLLLCWKVGFLFKLSTVS